MRPDSKIETLFEELMRSTESGNYERFVGVGDDSFRNGIGIDLFRSFSESLSARLKGGFMSIYFGALRQEGFLVHLWGLSFRDGSDDRLARMCVANDKVVGFVITPAF